MNDQEFDEHVAAMLSLGDVDLPNASKYFIVHAQGNIAVCANFGIGRAVDRSVTGNSRITLAIQLSSPFGVLIAMSTSLFREGMQLKTRDFMRHKGQWDRARVPDLQWRDAPRCAESQRDDEACRHLFFIRTQTSCVMTSNCGTATLLIVNNLEDENGNVMNVASMPSAIAIGGR